MGGKSDVVRYASEIPAVLAWDLNYTTPGFEKAKSIALATNLNRYNQNCVKAQLHKEMISADMIGRGFSNVDGISWQDNDNRNNNGSPADIVFKDHLLGGVSTKDGSDIIFNGGITEFSKATGCPKGEDIFRHLAAVEFDALLYKVVYDCLNELPVGQTWTKERKEGYGNYSITRISNDLFKLKSGNTYKTFSTESLLTWTILSKKGLLERIPNKWRRVFGDYYQGHKALYKAERDALYKVLYPVLENLCERIIKSDPDRLCQVGGFTDKAHYVSDLYRNYIYFVPKKADLLNKLKLTIIDNAKDKTFGGGFELRCEISEIGSDKCASFDFYFRYNGGTFKGNPVVIYQNLKGKENIWTKIL
jgi:hypothetical protein